MELLSQIRYCLIDSYSIYNQAKFNLQRSRTLKRFHDKVHRYKVYIIIFLQSETAFIITFKQTFITSHLPKLNYLISVKQI